MSCSLHLRGIHRFCLLGHCPIPSPIELLLVENRAGNQLVWFNDAETDCRSIQVGGLAGVFDGFQEGSQALCGLKEACDCQSIVMQPTKPKLQLDTHLVNMTVNGKGSPCSANGDLFKPTSDEAVRASTALLQLIWA